MKSHVVLLARILEDSSAWCCTSTTTDLKTIIRRVEDEGVSFLTITLPNFASDFERCLELGSVDSTFFAGWRKKGCLPAFLRGFTSQVFDKSSGVLLDTPSIECIRTIRQICNLYKKLEIPCSVSRERAALDQYVKTDSDVIAHMIVQDRSKLSEYRHMSGMLFWELFYHCDQKIYNGEVIPKHGPGATAERVYGNAKYRNRVWTERLEEFFLASEFLFTSQRHYLNAYDDVVWMTPSQEPPVRVVTVPKTLKAPRIIAIEPTHMQYVQQGLMEILVNGIEGHDLLSHFIGFTDQEPNRTMACHGSKGGGLATLDLSEASDRVSIQHVTNLFSMNRLTRKAVLACRSEKAEVPNHGIIRLGKYASMGSALTFPIEAMVFLTIVFVGIQRQLRTPLTQETLKSFKGKVRVYGDDIIIPVEYVHSVIAELEAFGLKVNTNKSFWTGKFRESCGGDYYDGEDVSYVKARAVLPASRTHVAEIVKTVALRNQLYEAGFWRSTAFLDSWLQKLIPFPTIHPESPGLGRVSYLDYEVQRLCPHLQRPLVKAMKVVAPIPVDNLDGEDALLKTFLKRGDEPFDKNHLQRAGRPVAVDIKPRWVTPY